MSVLRKSRHAGRRFARVGSRRFDPPPQALCGLPEALHDLRERGAPPAAVVKQNGTRADFDVDRIRNGFQRALHKRPVPTEYVDQAVERIVQQVLGLGEREIPSRQIGEMVMRELYKLDKVAYIRFASVYRSFQDAADFRDALKEVEPTPPRRKSR